MQVTIKHDDGKEEVFLNVTDAYLAVRQPIAARGSKDEAVSLMTCSGHLWGSSPREVVKEMQQGVVELQDYLRSLVKKEA